MREIAEHLLKFASSDWGPLILLGHAFFEAFILPGAHEIFLIAVCLGRPHLSFLFALISTAASTAGMCVGYAIGRWGGHRILSRLFRPDMLEAAEEKIHRYDFWAIAIACFTPIPVKVFVLIAGSVEMNFRKLVVVAFFSRGARYFLVALAMYLYGAQAKNWVLDYINWIMIALLAVMAVMVVIWSRMTHRSPLTGEEDPPAK